MYSSDDLKRDCRHFLGHVPCRPHKSEGVHCNDCSFYNPAADNVLIIDSIDKKANESALNSAYNLWGKCRIYFLSMSETTIPDIKPDKLIKEDLAGLLITMATPFVDIVSPMYGISQTMLGASRSPVYPAKYEWAANVARAWKSRKTEGKRVLIIKLGALGDVVRTTTLLPKIWEKYPEHEIWWLTLNKDILPGRIDRRLEFNHEDVAEILGREFDLVINLDKDYEACALTDMVSAKEKKGFCLRNGKPAPIGRESFHKYLTGLFDDLNKQNTKSYPREIFEICGWEFGGEDYILEYESDRTWDLPEDSKGVVGLNTGCGDRWISRLWADDNWIELIKKLIADGYYPVLLGGRQEDEKNRFFASETGAKYFGHFSLPDFMSLVDSCDVVVSAVTMGMHLAIGLRKQLVLMNNIFNPHEFELYGRGEIVGPEKECRCYFAASCTNEEYSCMEYLSVASVYNAVIRRMEAVMA